MQEYLKINRVTGKYIKSSTLGEEVNAFVPYPLPPKAPPLMIAQFADLNYQAEIALARLSGVSDLVPSVEWLLYSSVRKEALLTSQIEGTQATITDLFHNEAGLQVQNTDDVEEIVNYIAAYRLVRKNLADPKGLPISIRLLCKAHQLLLNGVRGAGKQPGQFRRSQNWIGGTRPRNTVFIPPPVNQVLPLMGDLEAFIHHRSSGIDQSDGKGLPPLVIIALVHA